MQRGFIKSRPAIGRPAPRVSRWQRQPATLRERASWKMLRWSRLLCHAIRPTARSLHHYPQRRTPTSSMQPVWSATATATFELSLRRKRLQVKLQVQVSCRYSIRTLFRRSRLDLNCSIWPAVLRMRFTANSTWPSTKQYCRLFFFIRAYEK